MFGFAGAQRTGKTTLAKAVAERLGFHYHDASVSRFAREYGVNAVGDLLMLERIMLQEYILKRFVEEIHKAPRPAITDRTPLDILAYMLGEVTMHNTAPEFHERIKKYADQCLLETTRHFDLILALRPLPVYLADPDKPPLNRAYQSMVQMLIEGAAQNVDGVVCGVVTATTLDARIVAACTVFSDHMETLNEQRRRRTTH